jgi:hypothetical protein
LGNAFYLSVQKILSFHLLSKIVNIRIYKTIILPVVYMGAKLGFLTLSEEHRQWVFENRMPKKIFGLKTGEVMGG